MDVILARRPQLVRAFLAALLGVVLGVATLVVDLRLTLTFAAGLALIILAVRYRLLACAATIAFLPFLGLVRRLLIPVAGWSSVDPLLLVAPLVMLTVVALSIWENRLGWRTTPLAYWLTLFALWMAVEMLNPGEALLGNLAGGMYIVVPMLWFFVGRTYADETSLRRLLLYTLAVTVIVALYGLRQTVVGFPPWDRAWIAVGGYAALNVGGVIRAFGTFSSSAEYGESLGIGIVLAFALLVRHSALPRWCRPSLLAVIALLLFALVLESQRGALVYAVAGCGLVWATAAADRRAVLLRLLVGVGVVGIMYLHFSHAFGPTSIAGRYHALITHDTSFLAKPFGHGSTLPGHLQMIVSGVLAGIRHPWGYGPGAVSLGGKLGGTYGGSGTEFDLSNAFTAGGVVGGLLFIPLWFYAWRRAWTSAIGSDWSRAAVLGIAVELFGTWLNGGEYFVVPLIWLLLGILDRSTKEMKEHAACESRPSHLEDQNGEGD